jgi:hypothetical protein
VCRVLCWSRNVGCAGQKRLNEIAQALLRGVDSPVVEYRTAAPRTGLSEGR